LVTLQKRNTVVKLIKVNKKEYYKNMIDRNKGNPTAYMEKIIRSEPSGNKEKKDINFGSLDSTKEDIVADKFNLFYI